MNLDFLQQELWGNSLMVYLRFTVILVLALLLKKYITAIFTRLFFTVFKKFSADYYGQQFKELLLRPVEGLIVTIFFYVAFNQLSTSLDKLILFKRVKPVKEAGQEVASRLVTLMDLIDHLFFLFLIFYFILLLSRLIDFVILVLLHKATEEQDRGRQQIYPLLKDVLKVMVWGFGFFTVLGVIFHVNVAALIAGLGVGGIAIAFAAKESLENLLASFMVMIDKPFTIGDWIKVNGVEGIIEKVGFRSTRIRSFDKSIVSLPNRKLIDSNLENFSERGMRRVKFSVGAIYGLSQADIESTISAIKNVILKTEGTMGQPIVHLDEFGASSVNILVIYFVSAAPETDFESVKEKVNFGIYQAMYQYARGFAYPTQLSIEGSDINEVVPPAATQE